MHGCACVRECDCVCVGYGDRSQCENVAPDLDLAVTKKLSIQGELGSSRVLINH
ncbi:UNVERIFIED_CONTAM: hypothetical protein FKN15_052106 [Acipenser sinensis]